MFQSLVNLLRAGFSLERGDYRVIREVTGKFLLYRIRGGSGWNHSYDNPEDVATELLQLLDPIETIWGTM